MPPRGSRKSFRYRPKKNPQTRILRVVYPLLTRFSSAPTTATAGS